MLPVEYRFRLTPTTCSHDDYNAVRQFKRCMIRSILNNIKDYVCIMSKIYVKVYCNTQVRQIKSLQGKYDVKIVVEQKETKYIQIQGEKEAAEKARQDVLKILQDVQKCEQEKEAAMLITSQVSLFDRNCNIS